MQLFGAVRCFVVSMLICVAYGSESTLLSEQIEASKPYVLLFSGPKGSGKSRLVLKVNTSFSIPYISTAELVMDHIHDDSDLGEMARDQAANSCCFSDEFFFKSLYERIGKGGCQKGFILEGMPRTLEQAESLYAKLFKTFNFLAFHIDVSDDWLINRVQGRLVCPTCGQVVQLESNEDEEKKICDTCKSQLQQRLQDSPEVLAEYLKKYRAEMKPIIKFYESKNILVRIRGDQTIDQMFNEIVKVIEAKTGLKLLISYTAKDRLQ